ncbi:hypothetical protein Tco_0966119 [Tanacetum coccineum]
MKVAVARRWRWWKWRVGESDVGDRVDPEVGSVFGLRRKSPPEKFSGGGEWWPAAGELAGEEGWRGRECIKIVCRKIGFGMVTSWREEDLIREVSHGIDKGRKTKDVVVLSATPFGLPLKSNFWRSLSESFGYKFSYEYGDIHPQMTDKGGEPFNLEVENVFACLLAEVGRVQLTGPKNRLEISDAQGFGHWTRGCTVLATREIQIPGLLTFKVNKRVGDVAYKLELPEELSRVHNTFHVSNLKKCHADEPLAVPLDGLHFDDKLQFVEEPIEITDREVKRLKRSRIPLVKVRWNSKRGPEFTWEREDQFRKKYPHLFTKTAPSSSAV